MGYQIRGCQLAYYEIPFAAIRLLRAFGDTIWDPEASLQPPPRVGEERQFVEEGRESVDGLFPLDDAVM